MKACLCVIVNVTRNGGTHFRTARPVLVITDDAFPGMVDIVLSYCIESCLV